MKRYNKIKNIIFFFNIKNLIIISLTFSIMLVSYFFYFKYKDLIIEKIILHKNILFNEIQNNTSPSIIILGNRYIDSKSLINELKNNLKLSYKKNYLISISNVLNKKELIEKFIITQTSRNLLTIKIKEKKIIGLTKIKNSDYLIDEFNNLIKANITPSLFHLPVFVGKNSNNNANIILRLIRESNINLNYISLSLIDNRRWNINLDNGVKILLPETKVLETLKLLKVIHSKYDILKGNFVEVDLRIHNKYFLKPKIN